jgi:SPP1 family predicted phage head-tail adaptor
MTDVIAYLLGKTITMNQLKQEVEVDTRTEIFAQKESISQSEFYKGGEAGLKPDFRLITAIIDYNGEREVELDGKKYGIYRTYERNQDYIELYCERKGGVQ